MKAFLDGDVELAYSAAQELTEAYHEALIEASRLRFRLNFGTSSCDNCTGLHAGPGVTATCFQVKRCDYKNIRVGEESDREKRILARLTGEER